MIYTPKQRQLMKLWQTNRLKRINLLEGSVSSGKTWISLVLWAFWVKTMPEDKLYMMCAKSLTTLKRNCLILLQELVGENNFRFSIPNKEGTLFGRRILLEGANDIRSESKIRGITLQGAYCDELTQFPHDFFTMLLSRLRLPGAKLIATTNPDAPTHWLKVEYIDRQEDLNFLDVKFLLDDNTTLPEEYVHDIKTEYTGVFYDRFIMGEWVLAEGLIYPMYRDALETAPETKAERYALSIDYGTLNAFAALLWGKFGNMWYAVSGYYYSGRDTGIQKTDEDYANDLEWWLSGYIPQDCEKNTWRYKFLDNAGKKLLTIVDPSAASFITLLERKRFYRLIDADNAVLDGIRETATALQKGIIKIDPAIKEWELEASGYVWDDNSADDRPVKEADHYMDSMRYFVKTLEIAVPKKEYRNRWNI